MYHVSLCYIMYIISFSVSALTAISRNTHKNHILYFVMEGEENTLQQKLVNFSYHLHHLVMA